MNRVDMYCEETERHRQQMIKEADAHHAFRKELQAIKDKLDMYGERALTAKERVIVDQRRAFFYPGEE